MGEDFPPMPSRCLLTALPGYARRAVSRQQTSAAP